MHRNLDRRVESLVRIDSPSHKEKLQRIIDLEASDGISSWHLNGSVWNRVTLSPTGERLPNLHDIMIQHQKAR